jgi:hypothetical protein
LEYGVPAGWHILVIVAALYYSVINQPTPTAVVAPCVTAEKLQANTVAEAGTVE